MPRVILHHADCLDILPDIAIASVDAMITDPPYPHVKREYGHWTTDQWWSLIVEGLIPQVRRVLKPTGSALFILQPNSAKLGQLRSWPYKFMLWICDNWNLVQDAYWWNHTSMPLAGANRHGLMRPSVKLCIWAGPPDCYRNQEAVLWTESQANAAERRSGRALRRQDDRYASGIHTNRRKVSHAAQRRGGVTPFNLLPCGNDNRNKHPAATPQPVADWWTRYLVPPGGTHPSNYQNLTIITDPPYGIQLQNHGTMFKWAQDQQLIEGDESPEIGCLVLAWAAKLNLPTLAFASPWQPWPGKWRNLLVWDKGPAVGKAGDPDTCWKRTWELIQIARNHKLIGSRDSSVIKRYISPVHHYSNHPNQKPVDLIKYFLRKLTRKGDVVFDPFMGAGSTGIACVQLGRPFIGVEKVDVHFHTAQTHITAAAERIQLEL